MLSGGWLETLLSVYIVVGSIALPLAAILFVHARKLSKRERSAVEALETVIENLGEGFYRTSLDGKQLSANPELVAINGYDTEAELIANVTDIGGEWYVDPSRRDEFKNVLAQNGKVRNFVSEIYRHKTRERIWISENARLVLDPVTGKPSHYEGTVNETTDIMVRIQEEEKLTKLTSHLPGGLFQLVKDQNGVFSVVFASSGFREMLDLQSSIKTFDIEHFISLIHPEDLNSYYGSLRVSRKSGRIWTQDFRVVTDGGKMKWLNVQATPESKSDLSTVWHGYLQDITSTKADEAAIRNLAYHDALTKLPNRRSLIERLEQNSASCQRRNEYSGLLFIDLDNFKALNDTQGHDVGDLLLIEISKRLLRAVRRNDIVARLAGDEFVILLDHLGTCKAEASKKATSIAQKVSSSFRTVFQLGNLSHFATASIGGLTFNGESYGADDILRIADTAMYDVKKSGRNSFKIHEEAAEKDTHNHVKLLADLAGLTDRNELELRFQPQLNRFGTICGAEALIRWNHPELGLLAPDKFMPIAERNGQIATINSWVLDRAFHVLKSWQLNPSTVDLRLAVNVALQQFMSDDFARQIGSSAKRHGADVRKLTLELTEKLVSKSRESSMQILNRLKGTGVALSLDDFGVDFSSLSLLADMPLNEIKIDGKFVKSMHKRPQDKALVKSILAMAEALGLATVAEHVETQAQEKLLMEYGCTKFQGFLYGGAMSQADFEMAVMHNAVVADGSDSIVRAA